MQNDEKRFDNVVFCGYNESIRKVLPTDSQPSELIA